MNRKDYQLIAQAIKDSRQYFERAYSGDNIRDGVTQLALGNLHGKLIDALTQDNPLFNAAKFSQACGYENGGK
jgi:hypothetical protein